MFALLFLATPVLAKKDAVGLEMSANYNVIVFADKYLNANTMIHFWAIPGNQTNVLLRQNIVKTSFLSKSELGIGPAFSLIDDHVNWTHYNIEFDFSATLGSISWSGYQLAQLSRQDKVSDNGLIRQQIFYADFPLGLVSNTELAQNKASKFYLGFVYSFGRTSYFSTNKLFLTVNASDTSEVWAAWLLQL